MSSQTSSDVVAAQPGPPAFVGAEPDLRLPLGGSSGEIGDQGRGPRRCDPRVAVEDVPRVVAVISVSSSAVGAASVIVNCIRPLMLIQLDSLGVSGLGSPSQRWRPISSHGLRRRRTPAIRFAHDRDRGVVPAVRPWLPRRPLPAVRRAAAQQLPVEQHEFGFWALWRHADVTEMLKARLSVEDRNVTTLRTDARGLRRDLRRGRPQPPRRRACRCSTATRPTTPGCGGWCRRRSRRGRSSGWSPVIESLVDDALDRIADGGTVDLIDTLAFPLPFAVISDDAGHAGGRRRAGCASCPRMIVRSLEPVPDEEVVRADPRRRRRDGRAHRRGDRLEARSIRPTTCSPR